MSGPTSLKDIILKILDVIVEILDIILDIILEILNFMDSSGTISSFLSFVSLTVLEYITAGKKKTNT